HPPGSLVAPGAPTQAPRGDRREGEGQPEGERPWTRLGTAPGRREHLCHGRWRLGEARLLEERPEFVRAKALAHRNPSRTSSLWSLCSPALIRLCRVLLEATSFPTRPQKAKAAAPASSPGKRTSPTSGPSTRPAHGGIVVTGDHAQVGLTPTSA